MYRDEVHHADQADFLCTLSKESENSFENRDEVIELLNDKIKFIRDIMTVIEEKEMYLHPVELLKITMELEEQLGEGHENISSGIIDPNLKNLIGSMALEDKAHMNRIRNFLEMYEKVPSGSEYPE
jgi:rubrerythrin